MWRAQASRVHRAFVRNFGPGPRGRQVKRMSATAQWDGSGTQEDLMYRDECILVVRLIAGVQLEKT